PVPLPGTLTLPVGSGPFPIVVLVHGSSASDRDETIGPNKPFRDLAWGLAERGIAVLRYDKRTYVRPAWFAGRNSTVDDETVQDALSALTIARALPEADSTRSFLLGHSLGAIMAPRIAKADGKVAGVIIMAGATRMPLIDQMSRQLAYLDSIGGADSAASRAQRDAFAPSAARVRALTPADSTDNAPIPGMGGTGTRYWLDLNRYDPALVMRQLRIGALVLTGLRDYQVPSDQADAWLTAAGSRSDITVKRYPGLNHLFMTGTGRPSPADYAVPGHVDSQVITDIAAWIRRQPAH
ncbi:MAG: alpha/beta hydrolase family protein, partial [Gemmatimonadales bacterium]